MATGSIGYGLPTKPSKTKTSAYLHDGHWYVPVVIIGPKVPPEREVFVDRTPPNAGSGNYYKYVGEPFIDKCYADVDIRGYGKFRLSASIDVETEEYGTSTNPCAYYHYYSDGELAYIITWFGTSYGSNGKGNGILRLWKRGDHDSRRIQMYARETASLNLWGRKISLDEWKDYCYDQIAIALPTQWYSLQFAEFFTGECVAKANYPGYYAFLHHREFGALPLNYELAAASSYLNQATNLPVASTNSIANVLEYAGVVEALVTRKFGNIRNLIDPRNAWLAYRYSYTTSKLDLEEYVELTRRLTSIALMDDVVSHGYARVGDTVCKCTAIYTADSLLPKNTKQFLEQYGLRLSLLNVWDMIPYSFVVDWFFHIGSFLEDLENREHMLTLTPREVWYSFGNFSPNGTGYYFRVLDRPHYNAPFVGPSSASGRTTLMRVADAVSLFT